MKNNTSSSLRTQATREVKERSREELVQCSKLLVWTLEQEKPKKKDILERIERLKQLAERV